MALIETFGGRVSGQTGSPYDLDEVIEGITHTRFAYRSAAGSMPVSYDGETVARYLMQFRDHIKECKFFNGFSIAKSVEQERRATGAYATGVPRNVRCGCGREWMLDGHIWGFKYMDVGIDDIIHHINSQYIYKTGNIHERIKRKEEEQFALEMKERKKKGTNPVSHLEVQ